MRIGVIGISFKTASLEIREEFAGVCRNFSCASSLLAHSSLIGSCIVLNTCNRSEIYFTGEGLARAHSYILSYLRRFISIDFDHLLYSYFGFDCFLHLAKVTSGVDSAVLGETEIQGQVKKSYEQARENGSLCKEMHYLFQKSLMIGKNIRFTLLYNGEKPSFERLFWEELDKSLLSDKSVLFVGASQVNAKLLKSKPRNLDLSFFLTNRTEENGKAFIEGLSGVLWAPWRTLHDLNQYACVVVGTSSHKHIITEKNLTESRLKHLVLFDLSLPRNVDPELAAKPGVTLKNIDDLHKKVIHLQKDHDGNLLNIQEAVICDVRKKFSIYHTKQKRVSLPVYTEIFS